MLWSMRVPVTALLLCGFSLLVTASAGAVPKPPPKFWSPAHCEQVIHTRHPKVLQVRCVGSARPENCRWTSGHRARVFSQLTVFTRVGQLNSAGEPGVVRSFRLSTRARPRFDPIPQGYGDQYTGWPAVYYMGHLKVLATHVPQARFRSVVDPIAARLMKDQQKTTSCTGG